MKKVKSTFRYEMHYLTFLNNRLIDTFTSYQELCDYCYENNYNLVSSTGL